jgi:hypothetical protein
MIDWSEKAGPKVDDHRTAFDIALELVNPANTGVGEANDESLKVLGLVRLLGLEFQDASDRCATSVAHHCQSATARQKEGHTCSSLDSWDVVRLLRDPSDSHALRPDSSLSAETSTVHVYEFQHIAQISANGSTQSNVDGDAWAWKEYLEGPDHTAPIRPAGVLACGTVHEGDSLLIRHWSHLAYLDPSNLGPSAGLVVRSDEIDCQQSFQIVCPALVSDNARKAVFMGRRNDWLPSRLSLHPEDLLTLGIFATDVARGLTKSQAKQWTDEGLCRSNTWLRSYVPAGGDLVR